MDLADGRRAAHVKWDGKTIALGTFTVAEAAEKCDRAKALTKKWRASMVPKPDVEWVKKALEKLNIRVVNDRPGRRRKDEVEQQLKPNSARAFANNTAAGFSNSGMHQQSPRIIRRHADRGESNILNSPRDPFGNMSTNAAMAAVPNEISTNAFDLYPNGVGGVSNIPTREESGVNPGDFSNLVQSRMGMPNDTDVNISSFQDVGATPGMESASASRQHYGILKEHHDNLLKELQQTTYMMQMYQRNYEEMEDQPSNMMGNPMFGSDALGSSMAGPSFGNRMPPSFRQAQALDPSMQYPYDFPPRSNSLGSGEFAQRNQSVALNQGGALNQGARNQSSALNQGARNQGGAMNQGAMSFFQAAEAADNDGDFQIQNQNSNAAYQEMQQQQQLLQQQQQQLQMQQQMQMQNRMGNRQQDIQYSSNDFQFGQGNTRHYLEDEDRDETKRLRTGGQGEWQGRGGRSSNSRFDNSEKEEI
mmetsp:Transcript_170/g.266  ORF Transcript_170/g.266 Transcript_170/m.266 type:complete len:475 (-) Transcript_170:158-1582(-)